VNESKFTQSIMRKLPKEIYKWKIMNMMQNGVADSYFSGPAGDCWVEFKYIKAPKREDTLIKPKLSALQLKWLTERNHEGRNVALIIGSDIGCYIQPHPSFDKPINKRCLRFSNQQVVKWIESQTIG